jgi:hypothetical protein
MKKIIVYRTANVTPNLEWDYIAHYEGECEGEHNDPFEYGHTPLVALKCFLENNKQESK